MLGRGDTSGSQVTTSSSIVGSRRDGREERHGLGLTATSTAERFALAITFLVAAAGSLFLTLGLDLQHSPDATLYTSGFSLFPSPLGTALGTLLGIEGLAIVQAVVIGTVAVSIVVLRVPLRSVVVALPLLIWLAPLGVDVIAGALFAWGWWRAQARWYWVAAGFHLSALLLVVAVSTSSRDRGPCARTGRHALDLHALRSGTQNCLRVRDSTPGSRRRPRRRLAWTAARFGRGRSCPGRSICYARDSARPRDRVRDSLRPVARLCAVDEHSSDVPVCAARDVRVLHRSCAGSGGHDSGGRFGAAESGRMTSSSSRSADVITEIRSSAARRRQLRILGSCSLASRRWCASGSSRPS